ncbi:NUDIX domain-containing protein [Roseovarius faecimaris]|uniref:NUDIX domain-containing protein n=1 Tax=Roseovarius faecimaris TaxID=2494550 RepID=A0A6I6IQT2_9RHOB|nr:NUDIX domain-containing protein [Roseovarius faecimaris]QGX97887.1 NUDIX domain-containing protein [Roseovarius faecimaris]
MPIRLSTRAVLLHRDRLLLVNAFPGEASDLWCAPGGGAEPGQSLPDNLAREVHEETGLTIAVGAPCLVNEFHNPDHGFHQVDIFFRCTLFDGQLSDDWQDPEGVVNRRRWFSFPELATIRLKPDSLPQVAFFGVDQTAAYDPLERLLPR